MNDTTQSLNPLIPHSLNTLIITQSPNHLITKVRFGHARRGQSLSDYALALGVVAAMMATMQPFIQRYVQAKIKDTTDDVLAISRDDLFDAGGHLFPRALRGRLTQRKGVDRREPNTGIGGGSIVADVTSMSDDNWHEQVVGGRRYPDFSVTHTTTPPEQQVYFEDVQAQFGPIVTPFRQWIRSEARKKRDARRDRQFNANVRHKDRKARRDEAERQEAERLREQLWDVAKSSAQACATSPKCRSRYEDPQKWRKFANRWNRSVGKKSPYRLDPNDPAGGFEKFYGVPLKDAASGLSDPAYRKAPDWWGQTDREDGLWKDKQAIQYPLFLFAPQQG